MELSRERFKQIVAQLKGSGTSDHDKRKAPRVGLRKRVKCTLLRAADGGPTESREITVRDLSPDGIGFLYHSKIAPGTLFAIHLPANDAADLVAIYKVRHCDNLEEGLFRVGGVLIKLCNDDPAPAPAEPAKKPEKAKAEAKSKKEPVATAPVAAVNPAEKDPKAPLPRAAA